MKKADPKNQSSELEQLQVKVQELTDALQRERADATNIRRRHDEQMAGVRNAVKANVVRDLLPVIDNFERALKHQPTAERQEEGGKRQGDETDKWAEGVVSILKQFEKTLKEIGVERIKTVGEPFDPRYHEAVSMEEGEGSTEVVSEELQSGYKLNDEVIRHAMVRVKLQ